MRRGLVLALVAGIALVAWLLASNDFRAIAATLARAGWGVPAVVALHLPQTWLSAVAWGHLIDPRPPVRRLFALRFVREGVNALLPVAQVGGEIVRARLLARSGVPLAPAAATVAVDLSAEMVAQAVFTLIALGLLAAVPGGGAGGLVAMGAVAGVALLAFLFVGAQRFGLFRIVERLLAARAAGGRWGVDVNGLHAAVLRAYADRPRLLRCGREHLLCWFAGAAETWAALHVLGIAGGVREAVVIEALGQAVRAAGFLIPGAIGVQEGGFLLIGGLFGIAAPQALALSLLRRVRELALGLPALALWHRLERRTRLKAAA